MPYTEIREFIETNQLHECVDNLIKDKKVPQDLICCISNDLMLDPVVLEATGCSYDRASIETWFNNKEVKKDPLTGLKLTNAKIIENRNLRGVILSFLQQAANNKKKEFRFSPETEEAFDQFHQRLNSFDTKKERETAINMVKELFEQKLSNMLRDIESTIDIRIAQRALRLQSESDVIQVKLGQHKLEMQNELDKINEKLKVFAIEKEETDNATRNNGSFITTAFASLETKAPLIGAATAAVILGTVAWDYAASKPRII
jgi:hypothetical protein